MGMESVRRGVDNVFNMFQHKQLNKRFLYVFLESAFVALVPDNKLDNLFRKQHSGSQRVKGVGRKMDGAGPVRNCVRRRQANRWRRVAGGVAGCKVIGWLSFLDQHA